MSIASILDQLLEDARKELDLAPLSTDLQRQKQDQKVQRHSQEGHSQEGISQEGQAFTNGPDRQRNRLTTGRNKKSKKDQMITQRETVSRKEIQAISKITDISEANDSNPGLFESANKPKKKQGKWRQAMIYKEILDPPLAKRNK